MKTEILIDDVMESLKERGHTEDEISKMSPEKAFDEYCNWHGLIGWGEPLRFVMANIQSANSKA